MLPSLLGTLIFIFIPFLDVIFKSFYNGVSGEFVAFKNYINIFTNKAFRLASFNTFKFIIICIPLLVVISLVVSILLDNMTFKQEFFKTTFLIPMAIPVASVVLLWTVTFNDKGTINGFLNRYGINGVDWLNSDFAFWVLVFTYIWRNLGYNIVLWLAGLSNISKSLYEAGSVDGANKKQLFIFITLPNLIPTIFTVSVLSLLNSFKVFREAYLVAGEYPHNSMYMLQHTFNNWFMSLDIDKLSAGATILSIIVFILILMLQKRLGE
ncbi:MAG: carbohydrate ABC transporter permease [Lachnospirales bacterium]